MKIPFNEKYIQRGGSHFVGYPYQRGNGLGSVFKSLWRFAMPFTKSVGKAVGRQALKTGVGIAQDVLKGDNVGRAVQKRAKRGGRKLARKALTVVSTKANQKGKGVRRRRVGQKGKGLGRRPKKQTKTKAVYKPRKTRKVASKRKNRTIDTLM